MCFDCMLLPAAEQFMPKLIPVQQPISLLQQVPGDEAAEHVEEGQIQAYWQDGGEEELRMDDSM